MSFVARATVVAALVSLPACLAPPVITPTVTVYQSESTRILPPRDKVDILFMIDNSSSMESKQAALRQKVPELFDKLREIGVDPKRRASYHLGVVTSDMGRSADCRTAAARTPGALYDGTPKCMASGAHFIEYDQLHGDATNTGGTDVEAAFACMTDVGTKGCGIEQPLEAVYQALKSAPAFNAGFLREDAILAVVFLTDEDDCSAVSDQFFTTSTADPLSSYRCVARGYQCAEGAPSSTPSLMSECTPVPNIESAQQAQLLDVNRYVNLFAKYKVDPHDVILVNISGPVTEQRSITTLSVDGESTRHPCDPTTGAKCVMVVDRACKTATGDFGDPAIRLQSVINAHPQRDTVSICETSYTPALEGLAARIQSQLKGGCLSSAIENPEKPDCVVYDTTYDDEGHVTENHLIPRCLAPDAPKPCFTLGNDPECPAVKNPATGELEHFSINIDRDPSAVRPPRTQARIECATIAH